MICGKYDEVLTLWEAGLKKRYKMRGGANTRTQRNYYIDVTVCATQYTALARPFEFMTQSIGCLRLYVVNRSRISQVGHITYYGLAYSVTKWKG